MAKTVLITGATKGIGLATSQKLARDGYVVIGIARTKSQDPFPGIFFSCDLSNIEDTQNVLGTIAASYSVDAIVNNVGIVLPQPLGTISLEALQAVMDLNVRVAIQVVQAFIESMKKKRWGRIVNISSRAAVVGSRDRTSYSAAKSALDGCTRTWALELALCGITVNSIAPGPIETELFREARPKGSKEEQLMLNSTPMGRLGTPMEVAAAIGFLLSEEAGYITGQVICVDGGGSL